MSLSKKFPILAANVEKSPFSSMEKVKQTLKAFHQGEKIGFTYTSSLKSMGLIPRSDGTYRLGEKYKVKVKVKKTKKEPVAKKGPGGR
jgi:hypothetical protein